MPFSLKEKPLKPKMRSYLDEKFTSVSKYDSITEKDDARQKKSLKVSNERFPASIAIVINVNSIKRI